MSLPYPESKKGNTTDSYFGEEIPDPYRWLEDDQAEDVAEWVKAQNTLTDAYLKEVSFHTDLKDRYRHLFNFAKMYGLRQSGPYLFYYYNDGLQNQGVLYLQEDGKPEPEVFIDPNTLSEEGTTTATLISVSPDNAYAVISYSKAGSDWSELKIIELASRRELPETLSWVKFSGAAWFGNGFFYTRYPEPDAGEEYSSATHHSTIYYHRLEDDPREDQVVYQDMDHAKRYHQAVVTDDQAFLVIYISTGTDGYETWVRDLRDPQSILSPISHGFKHKNSIIDHHNDRLLVLTDQGAPNRRLVWVDPQNPDTPWINLIPESAHSLESVSCRGGKLFVSFLENACTQIYLYNYQGVQEGKIAMPTLGTAYIAAGRKEDNHFFWGFSSFTWPGNIFRYDIDQAQSQSYFQPKVAFDPEEYESRQEFFESKDGTMVSMFIVSQKGLEKDGQRPALVYGYGGFNINLSPYFSVARLLLLEQGGVFALVNLRGGGEYGEDWHQAGMKLNKQNVFDDFIAAGEHLIQQGYTCSEKMAMAGGSNGGLLVAAVANQRPDLYRVALPAVGVMDMLRYHLFTVGWGWVPEYGSSEEDEETFQNLRSYSPIHNLVAGTHYPATLVSTADHDDRVVPAHSFKYIATLQEKHAGQSPVLIRIETDAGHGAGKPTEKIIEGVADEYAFLLHNLGVEYKKRTS